MNKTIYILLTFLFILTGYYSIKRLSEKPDVPFEYYSENSGVYAKETELDIDKVLAVNGVSVSSKFQLEFVIDSYEIGSKVSLSYLDLSGKKQSSEFEIIPYYHRITFIIITAFIGFVFLWMGFFVAIKRHQSIQAILLYWVLSLFGLATLTSPGYYAISGDIIGYIIRTLHILSYSGGGFLFVLFMISFPVSRMKRRKYIIAVLGIATVFISIFAVMAQLRAISEKSRVPIFGELWTMVEALLLISFLYGAYELIITYRTLKSSEDKRKIEWITWGLIAGVSPYVIFWIVPSIFGVKEIINEEYSLAFLILVPVSFVVAVIKYQVLDIELVVKRSFVYALLSLCIIGIYSALIYVSSKLFSFIMGSELEFINLIAVLISALAFNPLRNRLNKFADKVFYREKYEFDKAVKEVLSRIRECLTPGELGRTLISEIEKFIPVNAIAIIARKNGDERVKVLEQKNFENLSKNISALRLKQLTSDYTLPLALENKVEKDIKIDTSMETVFRRWNINAVVTLLLESDRPCGAIVLGDKLSGLKYSSSDFELLSAIASSAALALKRLELQEKLVQEEIEMSRLEELNELKSFYVASVSHDLKTPLTSIKVFTELMQSDNTIPIEKKNEYLQIIESETGRLTRLIDNVLDFAKIEKGLKQYSFTEVDLNSVLNEVLDSIKYYIMMNKFILEVDNKKSVPGINGDADAIKTALFNLITNSVKYSRDNKHINIITGTQDSSTFIEIADKGIGIPLIDQEMIFNPFFRSSSIEKNPVKGAGLGLSIVKHVMDAHHGKIEVVSEVDFGTKIRLLFPLKTSE